MRGGSRAVVAAALLVLGWTPPARAQAPGAGWVVKPTPPRQVQQVYWDLHKTTEAWTRIELRRPSGEVAPIDLVVQATWAGRARTSPPQAIRLLAQGTPMALLFEATFRLTLADERGDERTLDLTAPPFESRLTFPVWCDACSYNAVDSRAPASVLMELAQATRITGHVLGIEIELEPDDLDALRALAAHVGL